MATLFVHPENEEQLAAVKTVLQVLKITFEKEESPYNPKFVAAIFQAEEDIKNGKGISILTEDLWR